MTRHLSALALLALALAAPAHGADRSFTITGFDRIRVEGPFRVKLTTGVAPFARASGRPAALDSVSLEVQGRTLNVRSNRSAWAGDQRAAKGPVEIEVGTHELSTAWITGSGALAVDKVRGQTFDLAINGSASADVAGLDVDTLKVGLSGTASVRLGGRSETVSVTVRGASSLDASALGAEHATLGAEGAALIRLRVSDTAKIDAQGPATVHLDGGASCIVRSSGSAEVTGCR